MMRQSYAARYLSMCESLEEAAARRLERPLSEDERCGICNAGSLMMLDMLEEDIAAAESAAALGEALVAAAREFEEKVGLALEGLAVKLTDTMGREISAVERARIARIRRIDVAMGITDRIDAVDLLQREAVFAALLAELEP